MFPILISFETTLKKFYQFYSVLLKNKEISTTTFISLLKTEPIKIKVYFKVKHF